MTKQQIDEFGLLLEGTKKSYDDFAELARLAITAKDDEIGQLRNLIRERDAEIAQLREFCANDPAAQKAAWEAIPVIQADKMGAWPLKRKKRDK